MACAQSLTTPDLIGYLEKPISLSWQGQSSGDDSQPFLPNGYQRVAAFHRQRRDGDTTGGCQASHAPLLVTIDDRKSLR
jgi:hypothetical protein